MIRQIPTSIEDFRDIRDGNYEYIDKTHLITEIIDRRNYKVILLPRPRRFGKTLNMTTLKWFFEKREENVWHLFEDLHVGRAGEEYRAHFQKYPVVFISLKETKALNFDDCLREAHRLIRDMYARHESSLAGRLESWEEAEFRAILNKTADSSLYRRALKNLTRFLHQVHGVRPIVIIDEYDAGIHAAYTHDFYKEAIDFFGSFFLAGLKDNQHLERAVMTGILRVSQESIFSDLNNVGVYSLLRQEFNTCFGFTDAEVAGLLEKAGIAEVMPNVRLFYDGYEFGGTEIYNPWSILGFLANSEHPLIPYWVGTSSNALIQELLRDHGFAVQGDMQTLLEGGYVERYVNENVVFPHLRTDKDVLWSLLVFTGYLKAARSGPIVVGQPPPPHRLFIPNEEIATVYRTTFQTWMRDSLTKKGGALDALLTSLLEGNAHRFEQQLQKFAEALPSYNDVEGSEPEKFYHGMMIGLLASLEPAYEVRSNRESGKGRPDVLIKPRQAGKPGVVLELKAARAGEKSIERAMAEGLLQLEANDYAAELRASGVEKIQQMAVAFDGKRVMVLPKGAKPPEKSGAVKDAAGSIRKTAKKVAASAKKMATSAKKSKK